MKIFLKFLLSFLIISCFFNISFANDETIEYSDISDSSSETISTEWNAQKNIKVTVWEKVPWAWCWEKKEDDTYDCNIQPWFWTLKDMIGNIIKYFVAITTLAWVLFIVINWMMLSMWWLDSAIKDGVKKRIIWAVWWLILVLLSWVILNMFFPWIYT